MASLASELSGPQMCEFFNRFGRFGGDYSMVQKLLGHDGLMQYMVDAAKQQVDQNPYEITVEETLARFRAQNKLGDWGFTDEIFDKLAATAPAWPNGSDAFRSLRIRWDEGDNGVVITFERHAAAIERTFPGRYWRSQRLRSGKVLYQGKYVNRLRLLNGNASHMPVVEWVIVKDLSINRGRKDVASVRGQNSLADEGFVLAWLFPERTQMIDYGHFPAWFCAGYELYVPDCETEEWLGVVVVGRNVGSSEVCLNVCSQTTTGSEYSVPFLESAT